MRRLAALVTVAVALVPAACGGSTPAEDKATPPQPATVAASAAETAVVNEPTPEQLAARRELLRQIAAGTYHCNCTSAERARDRVARGLVKPPVEVGPAAAAP